AENNVFLCVPVGRNDEHNVATDGFLSGIAKETLSAFVPTSDHPVEILADDGIVGRVDDGSKQPDGVRLFQPSVLGGTVIRSNLRSLGEGGLAMQRKCPLDRRD